VSNVRVGWSSTEVTARNSTSASPQKADSRQTSRHVRSVPNIGSHCSSVTAELARPARGLSCNLNLGQLRCPTRAFARTILAASLLNLRKVLVTHTKWARGTGGGSDDEASNEAVTLLAVAATAAAMRSHSPWNTGTTLLKGLTVDANELPTADFDDRWSAMFALPPTTDTAQGRLDVR
jgi:hypothetical protein